MVNSKTKWTKVTYKKKLNPFQIFGLILFQISISLAMMQLNNVFAHFGDLRVQKVVIALPLVSLLIFLTIIFYKSKYSFSKIQRIKAKLQSVILMNKLYFINPFSKSIDSSITFYFMYSQSKLSIKVFASGASYTEKSNELANILSSSLGLYHNDTKEEDAQFVEYIFDLKRATRLEVQSINDIATSTQGIPVDSNNYWDFNKYPHALISGATGFGKSFFLNYLMLNFAKLEAEIYVFDPKRSDLSSLIHYIPSGHTHVLFTPHRICEALRKINDLMNLRYEKYFMTTNKIGITYKDLGLRPIIIFFDEVAAFMEEDKKIGKEADSYLKQIIFKGRQVGVTLVLSTQKPNAEAISTSVRDQIGLKVALGNMSKIGYKMTLGDDWTDLPKFIKGIGSGLIMIEGKSWNTPKAFQSPYLDLENLDFHRTLADLLEANKNNYIDD